MISDLPNFQWCYRDAFCSGMSMMEAHKKIQRLTPEERTAAEAMLRELGYVFRPSKETA